MSKDNIIGIVIIVTIIIAYSIWSAPSKEEIEAKRIQDSIAKVEQAKESIDSLILEEDEAEKREITPDSEIEEKEAIAKDTILSKDEYENKFGDFAQSASGEEDIITLENDLLILKINTKGGFLETAELKNYKTWDQDPLILFHAEHNDFSLSFYHGNKLINTEDLYFEAFNTDSRYHNSDHITISGNDSTSFSMRLYAGDPETDLSPKYIEFLYGIKGDDHMIDFDIRFVGLDNIIARDVFSIDWEILSPRNEKSYTNEQRTTTIYYQYQNDDVSYLSETSDDREELLSKLKWISFKQQFFSTTLIADNSFRSAIVETKMFEEEENPDFLKNMTMSVIIEELENNSFPMSIYLGPNHFRTLSSYDLDLERQIPLGWSFFLMSWINRFLVIPTFNWLDSMNLNYGLIILLLTIMLKIVLLPIAFKTYISSAKMRMLKPDIEELGKKFPKKEDSMKKQQATMALYKKAGVNPMAGCIPMILQLPILLALFRFFPASIELRQEAFLWADDLSSYDSILNLPFTIPFYGDHVSLFTILMAISTIIYTKMN
ncbi:MAG: membrane protein insertase YidC, partial [Bacteroidales bacterium]